MKNLNQKVKEKFDNFFDWIKGAELIELDSCNVKEDPIRPELDVKFRTSFGRRIYGVKYKKEICAIMCFGYTNEIPKTVEELDLITNFLEIRKMDYKIFEYGRYKNSEMIKYAKTSKFGLVLGRTESQGIAINEMMATNLPLLVLDSTKNAPPWPTKYEGQIAKLKGGDNHERCEARNTC